MPQIEAAPYVEEFGAAARVAPRGGAPAMLISAGPRERPLASYCILAAEPVAVLEAAAPHDPITLSIAGSRAPARAFSGFAEAARSALELLDREPADLRLPWPNSDAPFAGGLLGFLAYEFGSRFNLGIRTLAAREGRLGLHVGGAIVIDSDPEDEAEECRLKGAALARAVEIAQALDRSTSPPARRQLSA